MRIRTSEALDARQRASTRRVDRLVAEAALRDLACHEHAVRVGRLRRLIRRRLRALDVARQAVEDLEVEVGLALVQALDEGLSRNEAFRLACLERHLGRRFLELVADTDIRAQPDSSTGSAIADDVLRIPGDLRTTGTRPGATNERSR